MEICSFNESKDSDNISYAESKPQEDYKHSEVPIELLEDKEVFTDSR